jgi:prohibitin 2
MKKISLVLALVGIGLMGSGCGMEQIETGGVGLQTRFGELQGDPLPPGLHFYNPLTSSIVEQDVSDQKLEIVEECYTKDTQTVNISFAATFYPDATQMNAIYTKYKDDWQTKAVEPTIKAALKDAVGKFIADELVQNRDTVQKAAFAELKTDLGAKHIVLTDLNFTNLDFDKAYKKAVEAKVVAIQRAAEAKNQTVQVEEQAKQTVLAAKADAESMRIKTQALAQNHGLVEYEMVQKWDGQLPQIIMGGGTTPFMNVDTLLKQKRTTASAE